MGYSRKKLELTGQRYGKLTVLEPAENVDGRTAWLCRCDCGQECVVITQRLRSGRATNCGCEGASCSTPLPVGQAARNSLTFIDGTCVEMLAAKTVRRNNTSGVPGVDWWASKHLWRAAICFKGKRHYLGGYHRFEDAVKARKRAEEQLHDEFLREFAEASARGGPPEADSNYGQQ